MLGHTGWDAIGLAEGVVSYSFREPEWPPICECKYDEARDEMDREDCRFHCNMDGKMIEDVPSATRKTPMPTEQAKESAA